MISKYLKQPHPFITNNWPLIIISSLFISLFIYLFEPFGCSTIADDLRVFIELGYGLVTFVVLTFFLIVLPLLFKETFNELYWTLGKEFMWFIMILFFIGIGNFSYTAFLIKSVPVSLSALLRFQFYTLSIGTIPVTVAIMVERNVMLAHNLKLAMELNAQMSSIQKTAAEPQNEIITLFSDNRKESINVEIASLLFVESRGNYIHIHTLKEQNVEVAILRTTLKLIESTSNEFSQLIRCHRGFLVNTLNILQVKGNTQGYKLTFRATDIEIPLARSFAKSFQNHFTRNC